VADNTVISSMTGGDTLRDRDRAGVKTQIVGLDLGIGGTETLMNGVMPAGGDVAHGSTNAGNPLYLGAEAIAHGTNPTAVAAAQRSKLYANVAGVLFVIGGHPNVQTLRYNYTAAQTNGVIIAGVAGTKIVVTQIQVLVDNATTVTCQVRVGFAASVTPTTSQVVATHPNLPPGGGLSRGDGSGILGVSATADALLVTGTVPTSGSVDILVSYYTIAA
jgi:hypothetical protein